MSRRAAQLSATLLMLAIAGCGGSNASTSTTTASTTPGTTSSRSHTTTNPTTTDSSGGAALSGGGGGSVGSGGRPKPKAGGGSANVRVPATFAVTATGQLSPPSVAAPSELPVEVTVQSRDGHAHTVAIRAKHTYRLKVPAIGSAAVLIPGQHAGRFAVIVDGKPRGVLLIGGPPGP